MSNDIFVTLDSMKATRKAFIEWGITDYCVDQDCQEFTVVKGVIHIPPEAEAVVKEILNDNMTVKQDE